MNPSYNQWSTHRDGTRRSEISKSQNLTAPGSETLRISDRNDIDLVFDEKPKLTGFLEKIKTNDFDDAVISLHSFLFSSNVLFQVQWKAKRLSRPGFNFYVRLVELRTKGQKAIEERNQNIGNWKISSVSNSVTTMAKNKVIFSSILEFPEKKS